ncbi:MAG: hypothetical protein R3A45_08090 [Bdellovibrionota bacterium]
MRKGKRYQNPNTYTNAIEIKFVSVHDPCINNCDYTDIFANHGTNPLHLWAGQASAKSTAEVDPNTFFYLHHIVDITLLDAASNKPSILRYIK